MRHDRLLKMITFAMLPALAICGCSTSRNTAMSRFYHAGVTRYNAYFNGREAYDKGARAQEKSYKDNMLEISDMFPMSSKKVQSTGKNDFETAQEKAKKCIKLHSISAKPKKKGSSATSEKEKQWLAKNEYNPFLWHAWMLLADAQAHTGEFIEAASTYSYIARIYADEPDIVAEAQNKTAWCYAQLDWIYEADELFARSSEVKTGAQLELWQKARKASALIGQERYEESIPLLAGSLDRKGVSRTQRIREHYLLAQLYKWQGNNELAGKYYGKVIRMYPPYDIEFHARIRQTETLAGRSGSTRAMNKLERMLRDAKNKERMDQIYYAMGNMKMLDSDTLSAIDLYEKGAATDSKTPEKGILLLTLGNLYWELCNYEEAGKCYSQAVGLIGSAHKDFQTVKERSMFLEELSENLNIVKYQDSLQWLVTLPDTQVYRLIDREIERRRLEDQLKEQNADNADGQQPSESEKNVSSNGNWYFYNDQAVQRGKNDFIKQWGDRKLEDDWRRQNKTVLSGTEADASGATTDMTGDTLALMSDSIQADSLDLPDPYSREYYLEQIPYSPDQMEKSNISISRSLFRAGLVYKDNLKEYAKAEPLLRRIMDSYPNCSEGESALYHLYLMYSLWEKDDSAVVIRDKMLAAFPESDYTRMVTDSDYIDNARYGKHREDSIYAETYLAFREGDTTLVRHGYDVSSQLYPKGQHRPKFMFLNAAIDLQNGDIDLFLNQLKELVKQYPKSEVSQLAGLIAQGVQDGKILQSTSLASIWDRSGYVRQGGGGIADSLRPSFDVERYDAFLFILAYPEGQADENQLLFEIANYNFSNYMMRDFDLSFKAEQGIGMFTVSEFLNFDEAYTYSRSLYSDPGLAGKLEGLKALVISRKNLEILLKYYSVNDWIEFYNQNFLAIPEFELDPWTLYEELQEEESDEVPVQESDRQDTESAIEPTLSEEQ